MALLGATGLLGREILSLLELRKLPITQLLVYASEQGEGAEIEFRGELEYARRLDADEVAGCDLVLCAAPGVLAELLPALEAADTRVIDCSGVLEADPSIPLVLPDAPPAGRRVAVPRGIVAGLGWALSVLSAHVELTRISLTTLEPAAGAGREGVDELMVQTIETLQMSGESDEEESWAFPQRLAFDCLPLVGELDSAGETTEESALRDVLRRLLASPSLPIEITRIRVPTLSGSMASVHVSLGRSLTPERAAEIWRDSPALYVLEPGALPTPRGAIENEGALIGHIRPGREDAPALAFVLAMDDVRLGTAAVAVAAAERILANE
jgi:aspartate-semialdehyde dehydrogenase